METLPLEQQWLFGMLKAWSRSRSRSKHDGREENFCSGKGRSMPRVDLDVNFLECTPMLGNS
jgi:hypothetical protein